jgi:hypothetical protein
MAETTEAEARRATRQILKKAVMLRKLEDGGACKGKDRCVEDKKGYWVGAGMCCSPNGPLL